MEHHVSEAFDRLKGTVPGFHDSPQHREDVIVHALNRLPPKYVVNAEGKAVTEVLLDSAQGRASIDVKVIEAMKLVARAPRPTGG